MKTWNVVNDDGRVMGSGFKSIDIAIAMRDVIEAERSIFCYVIEVPETRYTVAAEGMISGELETVATTASKAEAEEIAAAVGGEVVESEA
jgi:hypothetical protein